MNWIEVKEGKSTNMSRVLVYKADGMMQCLGVAIWNGKNFLADATMLSGYDFQRLTDKPMRSVTHWCYIKDLPKTTELL